MSLVSGMDRSFPLRVAPIQGEALDSWLDAIAHRHHVPRRAVIERCAIAPIAFYGAWVRLLTPADVDGIAQATGYGRHVVDALALPRSGSGVGPLSGVVGCRLPLSMAACHLRWRELADPPSVWQSYGF